MIGLLNFACKVVVPGRAFLRRLINLTIGTQNPIHRIRITKQAQADLAAWWEFLKGFNGRAFFLSDNWVDSEALHLYTDASGSLGYGAVLGREWFHGTWPDNWASVERNITLKELFPIMAAIEVWAPQLADQRIVLHTDNQALVHIINATTSKDVNIMAMIRRLIVKCMISNIQIKARHVPGCKNVLADALSRQQVEAFKLQAPEAKASPVQLPQDIQPCSWFPDLLPS